MDLGRSQADFDRVVRAVVHKKGKRQRWPCPLLAGFDVCNLHQAQGLVNGKLP